MRTLAAAHPPRCARRALFLTAALGAWRVRGVHACAGRACRTNARCTLWRSLDALSSLAQDVDRVKYGVESKVLELVGFLPQSSTPRHLFTSRAECVVADPETLGPAAHRALQALILALEEDEMLAICRCARHRHRHLDYTHAMIHACACVHACMHACMREAAYDRL